MFSYLHISENLRDTFRIAISFAKENKNDFLGVSHLFRGLMHPSVGLHGFLKSLGKDIGYLVEWAEVRIDEYPKVARLPESPAPDEKLAVIMEEADKIRIRTGQELINPVCLLAAIVKPNFGYSTDELKSLPLRETEILDSILGPVSESAKAVSPLFSTNGADTVKSTGALYTYCIDKNARVKEKADPVVGRDKELLMIMEILGRRSKPNVLLIGEPGVGKSALADAFVASVNASQVPVALRSSAVFELDTGALLAGASYKGEVEDRVKKIIKDLKQFEKAILFIDEIHTLIDPKGPAGNGVANLLKPELARGELTLIGATTLEEYRKIIEPDAAFNRRFETVTVAEPNSETAFRMIQAVIPAYEKHHEISVSAKVIQDAVRLAKRYIKDKKLPDSAIDLLDRTMAAVKMVNETSFEELEKTFPAKDLPEEEKYAELKWEYDSLINRISPILQVAVRDGQENHSLETSGEIEEAVTKILSALKMQLTEEREDITSHDLAAIISYKTGIPVGKIQSSERDKLLNIENHLKKRVVGQDHAIRVLSDTIVESRSGINKAGQPVGSFFFLGPTGTGKTELTKAIAEFLFNDEKAMIRFDMSEFKEEHSAALLYGAPPGYVGYEEGGMLVNKIRQQPYSVVLFDEIEKAHPSVFDTFLQIMDEGVLHDKLGKEGDFSNAIIIFTSNIGSDWVMEQFQNGKDPSYQLLMEVMGRHFRPEFLARLSEIIPFAPITEENVVKILEIQLISLISNLAGQGIELYLSPAVKKKLALSGFTPKYGARQLSAVIRNRLRRPIARMLVASQLVKGDRMEIDFSENEAELEWKIIKPKDQEQAVGQTDFIVTENT